MSGSGICSQWTRGEKQLSLGLLVVLLYHFNVFSFVHNNGGLSRWQESGAAFDYRGADPATEDGEDVDKVGNNWMPITDTVLLKCANLDALIKKRGDVVEDEKVRWTSMGCEGKLASLYSTWQQHSEATKGECEKLRAAWQIEVGVDWGFATRAAKRQWSEGMCDCHYSAGWSDSCLHGKPPTVHSSMTAAGIQQAVDNREEREKVSSRAAPAKNTNSLWPLGRDGGKEVEEGASNKLPVLAIVLGTTSRGFRWSELLESPLVKILLSSLERTLEQGFSYRVYVGFDAGDLFYDDDDRRAELLAWFNIHVRSRAAARGVDASFLTLRFLNVLRKPGPIFNFLTASAFADGADFVYRVNDDTEFRTPFAAALTTALRNLHPPYLGVVGPSCADGNKKILTHDFVHRTHKHIFQTYYPVVLTDWWMDDWISKVYPRGNFGRHSAVAVSHHTWMTGSGNPVRYEVDHSHKQYLNAELRRGAQLIGLFAATHCREDRCHMPDGHVTPEWQGTYDAKNQTVFASVFDLSSEYEKYDYAATRTSSKADKYTDSDGSSAFSDSSTEKAATQLKEAADGIAEREAADNSYASDYVSAAYASAYAAALNGTYEHHADLSVTAHDADKNAGSAQKQTKIDATLKTLENNYERRVGGGGEEEEEKVEMRAKQWMVSQAKEQLEERVAKQIHNVYVPRTREKGTESGSGEASKQPQPHAPEEIINELELLRAELSLRLEQVREERREKMAQTSGRTAGVTSKGNQEEAIAWEPALSVFKKAENTRPTLNVLKRESSEKKKREKSTPRAHSSQTHTHTHTHTTLGIVVPFHDSSSEGALSGSAGDQLRVQQQHVADHTSLREKALLDIMQRETSGSLPKSGGDFSSPRTTPATLASSVKSASFPADATADAKEKDKETDKETEAGGETETDADMWG